MSIIEPVSFSGGTNFDPEDRTPPKYSATVKPGKTPTGRIAKNSFEIILVHPNTKEIIYSKNHKAKDFNEAFDISKGVISEIELLIPTWFEKKKYIPAPRKGKMKLKTRENSRKGKKSK